MGISVYFLLTLPHLLTFFTMDLNTGQYFGFIYPLWLIMIISFVSGIVGNLIVNYLEK
jgi:hypothetical protein